MRLHLLLLLHLLLVSGQRRRRNLTEIIEKIRIGKESFDAAKNLHYMWHTLSVKALLVQVSKGIVPFLDKDSERNFLLCLNRIEKKTDLVRTSKCLVEAKNTLDRRKEEGRTTESPSILVNKKNVVQKGKEYRIGETSFKMYRRRSRWDIRRQLLIERHIRFFSRHRRKEEHRRVKRSEYRLIPKGVKPANRYIRRLKHAPNLIDSRGSPVQQLTKTVTKLFRNESRDGSTPRWADTYRSILKIKRDMEAREKEPSARMYDSPVDELVFNKTLRRSPLRFDFPLEGSGMPTLVNDALSLADSFRAHTEKTKGDYNYKFLSPRFAPVLPDKYEGRGLFSPSVLAFYKDESEDQIVPLPSLLDASGMEKKDRDSLLEMIMEISGARETVQEAAKVLQEMNLLGIEGEFVEATKKIQGVFDEMANSFTNRQKDEIEKRLFTFLEKDQLVELYKKQGLQEEHHEEFDLDQYDKLSYEEREEALWKRIELIAANETVQTRSKRQIPNVLSVLAPTVLSPYMFSPVYGLTVLGPAVFSPSLLSPMLMGGAILSPGVASPAIFSKSLLMATVLSPTILS